MTTPTKRDRIRAAAHVRPITVPSPACDELARQLAAYREAILREFEALADTEAFSGSGHMALRRMVAKWRE